MTSPPPDGPKLVTEAVLDTAAKATPTLWRDLLLRLLPPLLLIVATTGTLGVSTAQTLISRTFDRWLIDTARSLAHQVHFEHGLATVDLGSAAEAILAYDVIDRTYFNVRQGDRHVAGHQHLPSQGSAVSRYEDGEVFDANMAGRAVRVAAVNVGSGPQQARVLVAETLLKRNAVRADLQWMLLPLAALLVAATLAVVLALRWTLRPLEAIARRWNERSHRSLQAIDLQGVPRELLPFASALNDLLGRIHQLLLRERRFAANAAHQIRTPLTGLQLGLARAAVAPDLASARATIEELQSTTQRTARLLQQLMALGRLDPETAFELDRQPVDLALLAHDVGALYLDNAQARQIDLALILPDALAAQTHSAAQDANSARATFANVQADLVSEALGNLVDNALRYAGPGARVEIAVLTYPPGLQVADSGPGLPPELREAVLERFVRGPQATGDGSGLGLAIVREIAELHGATLQLTDSALGGLAVRLVFSA